MAAISFAARFADDGLLTIPQQAVETLKLHPGDEITVRIEVREAKDTGKAVQTELHRKLERLFEEADNTVREPGKPLTDPFEATWAAGVEEKARKMGIKL